MGPNARRAVLIKAASALEAKADAFVEAMMGEIGGTDEQEAAAVGRAGSRTQAPA